MFKSKHAIEIMRDIGFIKGLQTIYNHNTPKKENNNKEIELRNVVTTEQPIALDTQTEAAVDTERNVETDRGMVNREAGGELEIKSKYRRNVKINE